MAVPAGAARWIAGGCGRSVRNPIPFGSPNREIMRQFLIVDADDTLWENNIYFERAFDEFVSFLDHSSLKPPEVRAVLDAIEAANAKIHGYGSLHFARELGATLGGVWGGPKQEGRFA